MTGSDRSPSPRHGARASRPGSGAPGSGAISVVRIVGTVAATVTVAALHAPWGRSGRVDRTSLEILASAASVEVITGWTRWLALMAWWAVTVLVAASFVGRVVGRRRLADGCLVGLVVPVGVLGALVASSPVLATRWGLVVAVVSAAGAGVCGGVAAWRDVTAAKGRDGGRDGSGRT